MCNIIIIIIFKPFQSGCSEQRCYSKHSTPTSWSRWTLSIPESMRAYLGMSFPLGNVTKPGLPKCCSLTWWEICVPWWPWKLYELGLWSLSTTGPPGCGLGNGLKSYPHIKIYYYWKQTKEKCGGLTYYAVWRG